MIRVGAVLEEIGNMFEGKFFLDVDFVLWGGVVRKKRAILRLSVTQALSLNLTDHKITPLKKRDSEENHSCGHIFSENSDYDPSAKACGTKRTLSSLQRQGCALVKRLCNVRL